MNTTLVALTSTKSRIKPNQRQFVREDANTWPRDLSEAYARPRGPYTIENAETILNEDAVELYNGWLVWQEMTNPKERRIVATLQTMLDVSARKANFGQVLPDQVECLLKDGTVVKPDASLISWQRFDHDVVPHGPNHRPTLMGCPELVVEVRSPSNRRAQEKRKRKLYFANRTQVVWDVDEIRQEIWVYQVENPEEPLHFGFQDELDCEPLLPGWRRRVADIFAPHASAEAVAGEVAEEWRNEGKLQGIEIGMEEGAAQALRSVLPMLVRIRFATQPSADLEERLLHCNLAQLQQLQNAIENVASFEQWLALLPK